MINKYIEKTGNTYNSYINKNTCSDDDIVDGYKAFLKNPEVKNIVDKINEVNHIVSSPDDPIPPYIAVMAQAKNPSELKKFLDIMSGFVAKAGSIEKRFFNNIIDCKKYIDDYAYTMEHASEIISKMKHKNYSDSDIEYVLQILSKENYNSLKYLFE